MAEVYLTLRKVDEEMSIRVFDVVMFPLIVVPILPSLFRYIDVCLEMIDCRLVF